MKSKSFLFHRAGLLHFVNAIETREQQVHCLPADSTNFGLP